MRVFRIIRNHVDITLKNHPFNARNICSIIVKHSFLRCNHSENLGNLNYKTLFLTNESLIWLEPLGRLSFLVPISYIFFIKNIKLRRSTNLWSLVAYETKESFRVNLLSFQIELWLNFFCIPSIFWNVLFYVLKDVHKTIFIPRTWKTWCNKKEVLHKDEIKTFIFNYNFVVFLWKIIFSGTFILFATLLY